MTNMDKSTSSGSTSDSTGYPDHKISPSVIAALLDLPDGGRMDERWFRDNVWADTHSVVVPPESVLPGMQVQQVLCATLF